MVKPKTTSLEIWFVDLALVRSRVELHADQTDLRNITRFLGLRKNLATELYSLAIYSETPAAFFDQYRPQIHAVCFSNH